jgi:hypothetical protein
MAEHLIKSLGHGVYHVGADDVAAARNVAEQIGVTLEVWSDPEEAGSHTAVLESGFNTSRYEGSVATDPEVAASVRRAVACSPPGSLARSRLRSVSEACVVLFGGTYDASTLEP